VREREENKKVMEKKKKGEVVVRCWYLSDVMWFVIGAGNGRWRTEEWGDDGDQTLPFYRHRPFFFPLPSASSTPFILPQKYHYNNSYNIIIFITLFTFLLTNIFIFIIYILTIIYLSMMYYKTKNTHTTKK